MKQIELSQLFAAAADLLLSVARKNRPMNRPNIDPSGFSRERVGSLQRFPIQAEILPAQIRTPNAWKCSANKRVHPNIERGHSSTQFIIGACAGKTRNRDRNVSSRIKTETGAV
jgi:hypothetical protein